jgi:hypothetical protein
VRFPHNKQVILSVLDIVKHAVKTIAHVLGPQDRLSLVSYSTSARTVTPLTPMNEQGRQTAVVALEALEAGGQTNLWSVVHFSKVLS